MSVLRIGRARRRMLVIGAIAAAAVIVGAFALTPESEPRKMFGVLTKSLACVQSPGSSDADGSAVGFGDSITGGTGYAPLNMLANDSYFDVLACEPDSPIVRVANRGIMGNTTSQMLDRLEDDVLALDPELVLLVGGTNDVAFGDTSQTIENLDLMRARLEAAGIRVVFGTIPPNDTRTSDTISLVEEERAWAERAGVEMIDFYAALSTAEGKYKPGLTKDGTHPSAEGARVMADVARAFLTS